LAENIVENAQVPSEAGTSVPPTEIKIVGPEEGTKTEAPKEVKKTTSKVVRARVIVKKNKPETMIEKIFADLIKGIKKMGLTERELPSRLTFSNGNRVVALERGKRQVTLHLPKQLKDADTPLKKTFDKRGFGYVRINSLQQVPDALSLIEWAQSNNK